MLLWVGLGIAQAPQAFAATVTDNMNVQLIVQASCSIGTVNDLDFGTATTPLNANIDATTTLTITCTNTTPYRIGLNQGSTAGASTTIRKMFSTVTTEDVDYMMYTNAARTSNWGNNFGTDTNDSVGTGAAQTFTVYGRVPPQTTPAPATYTDVVVVTVDY